MIKLVQVKRSNCWYQYFRNKHYVPNKGCIGKQIHCVIFDNDDVLSKPIGIISGASAVWACQPRDNFFGINKDNRIKMIDKIINNVVFRLEKNEKNLASKILAIWRKQIIKDWLNKYGGEIIGFETFVFGSNRYGTVYKADNWVCVGKTKGSAKRKPWGAYNKGIREKTDIKLIFCKKI